MGGVGGGIGDWSGVEKKEQMLVPDGLLFELHMFPFVYFTTESLGSLLSCMRYAKCCASG